MDDTVLQQILDRQAITDRLHWYTRWVDLNRVDKQVEVFTDDGRLTFHGDDAWIEGRDAIEAMIAAAVARYEATHHYISNVEIDFDGRDGARSSCYVQAWHRPVDGGPDYTLHAQYHDVWTRTPDGWRITERRLKAAGTSTRGDGKSPLEPIGRAPV